MKISLDEVRYITHLARLELKEQEIEESSHQLGRIISYVEKINELKTDDIPPTSHVLALRNVMREDNPESSLKQGEVLSNAPSLDGDYFKVPKVIE